MKNFKKIKTFRSIIKVIIILLCLGLNRQVTAQHHNELSGESSGRSLSGSYNAFYGDKTGSAPGNSGSHNVFIGAKSGQDNTTGNRNTFVGFGTGYENKSGKYNVFIGYVSGYRNVDGIANTAIGYGSGMDNTTGRFNTFTGYYSGSNNNGWHNTFYGSNSGQKNVTGSRNTFMGFNSGLENITGIDNTFNGYESGHSNKEGDYNTFYGAGSGYSNTEGNNNTFCGSASGYSNQTGSGNVFIGYQAGYNETGSDKLYIDNSETRSPLLYGDFKQDFLAVNGNVGVGIIPSKGKLHVRGSFHVENNDAQVFHVSAGKQLVFVGATAYEKWTSANQNPNNFSNEPNYSLWVSEGIVSEKYRKVQVDQWADHVFEEDYQLTKLDDLKAYIKANGHLPAIPSEEEVKRLGYDMHTLNVGLLTTIEELTLYTIEQEDKIQSLEEKVDEYGKLAAEVEALKALILELKR